MRVKIDAGGCTFLYLCECGSRGLPQDTRSEALREARHHEQRAHPGDKDVLRQANNHARDTRKKHALFVEPIPPEQ